MSNSTAIEMTSDSVKLCKLGKLIVIGDFDGDGKKDTVFQHNYSRLMESEIDYSADPFQNEWDTVIHWFHRQDADLFLRMNASQDTLHLGTAQGLYCLINIGDNNADGKDEIALVVDRLDFSRVNACIIYSLCNHEWTELKQFAIHEDAFTFTLEEAPVFDIIKGYLEKYQCKWVYKDYLQEGYESIEDVGVMKSLEIDKCK